jgi:hypothetical protein
MESFKIRLSPGMEKLFPEEKPVELKERRSAKIKYINKKE